MRRALPALGLVLLCAIDNSPAQSLRIPLGEQGRQDTLPLPQPGESRRSVLERFGLADDEHPAVGQPPISRWDYRSFSVYFEGERVIDSVRHHQPQHGTQARP